MLLENFRSQKIIWDRANKTIFEKIEANSGDSNGRKLVVQVINQGVTENLLGTTLSLGWKYRKGAKGLDAFNVVDASKGIFEIYYTTEMLSNIGNIEASLILIDSTGRIESSTFTISVTPSTVDDESVESENSFTALTEALVKVNDLEGNYAPRLNEVTAQLAQTEENVNSRVDNLIIGTPQEGEVIDSRQSSAKKKTFPSLGARLENIEQYGSLLAENLFKNAEFSTINDVLKSGSTITVENNILTLNGTAGSQYPRIGLPFENIVVGHKYYVKATMMRTSDIEPIRFLVGLTQSDLLPIPYRNSISKLRPIKDVEYQISGILSPTSITESAAVSFITQYADKDSLNTVTKIKKPLIIDLTSVFGTGKEPSVEQMDKIISHIPESWFTGKVDLVTSGYLMDSLFKKVGTEHSSEFVKINKDGTIPHELVGGYSSTDRTIVDDSSVEIDYIGAWQASFNKIGNHLNTAHLSSLKGNSLAYVFTGTGIEVYDTTFNNRGKVEVFIDGISQGIIDRYSSTEINQQLAFKIDHLAYGEHTIKITIAEDINLDNVGISFDWSNIDTAHRWFSLDFFVVLNTYTSTFNNEMSLGTIVDQNSKENMKLWIGTQAEYDAIPTKDTNIIYMIGV